MAPPLVKKAAPPSRIVASEMVDRVKDALAKIKNGYGAEQAERLVRAADEGANLGLYSPRALERAVGGNGHLLTVLEPGRFQDFAARIPDKHFAADPYNIAMDYRFRQGRNRFEHVMESYGDIGRESGWSEVPELRFSMGRKQPILHEPQFNAMLPTKEDYPYVQSHEGRHRNMAIETYLQEPKSLVVIRPHAQRDLMLMPAADDAERLAYFKEFLESRNSRVIPETQAYSPLNARGLTEKTLPQLPPLYAKGGEVEGYETGGRMRGALRFANDIRDWFGDHSAAAISEVVDETRKTGREAGRFGFGNRDTGQGWLSAPGVGTPGSVKLSRTTDEFAGSPGIYLHTPGHPTHTGYDRFRTDADSRRLPEGFDVHTHPPLDHSGRIMDEALIRNSISSGGIGPLAPSNADIENWMYPHLTRTHPSDPRYVSYIVGGHHNALLAMGDPEFNALGNGWRAPSDVHDKFKRVLEASGKSSKLWKAVNNSPVVDDVMRDYSVRNRTQVWAPLLSGEQTKAGLPLTFAAETPFGNGYLEGAMQDLFRRLSSTNSDIAGITGKAEGGEVQKFGKGSLVERAKGALSNFIDKPTAHLKEWPWNPLEDVASKMPAEIPQHVLDYGNFMQHMTNVAGNEGLTPRDLIKAYTTTRASIQRQARDRSMLDPRIPLTETGRMVRPEGAFADWLQSPMGEKYLKYATEGEAHPETISDAMNFMRTFGLHNKLGEDLTAAPSIMPGREGVLSKLIADSGAGTDNMSDWFDAVKDIPGINSAKRGFLGALLGYGRLPTLDARQIEMNVPKETRGLLDKFGRRGNGRGGEEAVERLADRIRALDFGMPDEYRPFDMHLGHHTMWDAAKGDLTTHDDLKRMMLNRAEGGPVQHFDKGNLVKRIAGALTRSSEAHGVPEQEIHEAIAKSTKNKNNTISDVVPKRNYGEAEFGLVHDDSMLPQVDLRPEDLKGRVIAGTISDRLNTGSHLTDVLGKKLIDPVYLEGGYNFPRGEAAQSRGLWASEPGALTTVFNNVKDLEKKYDAPVSLTPLLMGRTSLDSTKQMSDVLGQLLKQGPMNEALQDFINAGMRKKFPTWPGINSENWHDWQKGLKISDRSFLPQLLDSAAARDVGGPNIGDLRIALTDPTALITPNYHSGRLIGAVDTSVPPHRQRLHSGYGSTLTGDYQGDFGRWVPPEIMYGDDWAERFQKGNPSALGRRVMMRSLPHQYMDQKAIDRISGFMEEADRLGLPKAEGGTVGRNAHGGTVDDNPPSFDFQTPEIGSEGGGILSNPIEPLQLGSGPSSAALAETRAVDDDAARLMASAPKPAPMKQQQSGGGGGNPLGSILQLGAQILPMFLQHGGSVPGYAAGGYQDISPNDFDDSAWLGSDALSHASDMLRAMDWDAAVGARRFTSTPAERRTARQRAIDDSQPRIDEINRSGADFWRGELENLRNVGYHPAKYGVGALHRIGAAISPEGPSAQDIVDTMSPDMRYRDTYGPVAAPLDVLGIIAGTMGGGGMLGRLSTKALGEAMPLMRRMLAPAAAPVVAEGVRDMAGYADGGVVGDYKFGGETQWDGVPGASMYAEGGGVAMKDGGFLHDALGTIGGLIGNFFLPVAGGMAGSTAGNALGDLFEGHPDNIDDDARRNFTMGLVNDSGEFDPGRIPGALKGAGPQVASMFMAQGGGVGDDDLLYHAIDTQNFSQGGALRACGGYGR